MACDQQRRNDLDGRGNLSEEELAGFIRFFLETCIDQVEFMRGLVQPSQLRGRILIWAKDEIRAGSLPAQSDAVLQSVLYEGKMPKRQVASIANVSSRQARRITSALIEREVLTSKNLRAPLRLAFPAKLASRWMPGLFPDKAS